MSVLKPCQRRFNHNISLDRRENLNHHIKYQFLIYYFLSLLYQKDFLFLFFSNLIIFLTIKNIFNFENFICLNKYYNYYIVNHFSDIIFFQHT